jgi:glycine cleavage system regulatory protein
MAIHTDVGPTRARIRAMIRGPIASFDSLGDQLAFHLRAIRWIPQTIVHYRKEVLRLIAEVTFGVGVLAVLGGTIGVIVMMSGFTGVVVGLQGYAALDQIGSSVLTGFLKAAGGAEVNQVNAPSLAKNRGLNVIESRHSESGEFSDLIEVVAESEEGTFTVGGTLYGAKPRIVTVNGNFVEVIPSGTVLLLENRDRPGIVGHIGTLLGRQSVNIAGMSLSRDAVGGKALTLLNLDSVPGESTMAEILGDPDIHSARVVRL